MKANNPLSRQQKGFFMKNNYDNISDNKLFTGITAENLSAMFSCMGSYEKKYSKNENILYEGDTVNFVGIVLKGAVKIINSDYDGNEVVIAEVTEGDMFAEVFACAEIFRSPVNIVSASESVVLFIDYRKIVTTCSSSCAFHHKLISNMLKIIARKSLYLNRRIDIISKRTLRDKILTYFHYESMGRKHFTISMNREELANFLCADRSALSNELSKMKKDGLIDYNKNDFKLYD